MMIFSGDPDSVQRNLHNDLNNIIKNIKIRQDQYIELLQYNRNFITLHREFDANVFINDELVKHKSFYTKKKNQDVEIRHEQDHIMSKYQYLNIQADSINKLMSRVGARILEIFQASHQKIKAITAGNQQRHKKMKLTMLKFLNQNQKLDIPGILTLIITYANEKVIEQITKLEELIRILEQGQPQKVHSMLQIKAVQADRNSSSPFYKRQPSLDLKRQKEKLKQKIEKLKQQAKQNEKIKKQKTKTAQKMLNNMHSTMDISKNQFLDDVVTCNPKEKYKKLYEEIFTRNKFNREQIIAFEAKTQQFQKKVKQFKAIMLSQSQKIQQAVIIKKFKKKTQNQHFPPSNQDPETYNSPLKDIKSFQPVNQDQNNQKFYSQEKPIVLPEVQITNMKLTQSRAKMQGQKGQSPKIGKQLVGFSSMQSTQQVVFQHLKFDNKQQQIYPRTNRARLPQIGGRVSLQTNFSSKKKVKNEQKVSIVVPVDMNNQVERPAFANFRIENVRQKQRGQSTENKDKLRDSSIQKSMQYTFYIKKRTNKFYETKNHFIM